MNMTEKQVQDLAEAALDAACALIQETVYPPNMADGGAASMFFSGPEEEGIRKILTDYIRFELNGLGANQDVVRTHPETK